MIQTCIGPIGEPGEIGPAGAKGDPGMNLEFA